MTTQPKLTADEQLAHLHAPFPPEDLEWRFQSSGKGAQGGSMLPFIQNRAVMDRLDQIVGPGNWSSNVWSEGHGPLNERVWCCRLKAKLADGRELEHVDVADATQIEPSKGGASDAMKRAAVKLGIGRYLYFLPKFYVDQKPSPMWKWHQHIANHMPQKCPWAVPGGAGRPPEGKGSDGWAFDTSYASPAPQQGQQPQQQPRPQQQQPSQAPQPQRQPPQQQRQQEAFPPQQQRQPMAPPPRQDGDDPDCPLPQHSPPPFDLSERIPFGTNQGKAWGHMAMGSPDGRRRGWLKWLYDSRESANVPMVQDAGFRAGQILAWLDGRHTPAEDPWAPAPPQQQRQPGSDDGPQQGRYDYSPAPGSDPGYVGDLGDDTPF